MKNMKLISVFIFLLFLVSCAKESPKKPTSDAPKPPPMSEELKNQDNSKKPVS